MYFEAQYLSRRVFFFTVSPKVLGEVVPSGQNKNLLWECDHWTKVRLRREQYQKQRLVVETKAQGGL